MKTLPATFPMRLTLGATEPQTSPDVGRFISASCSPSCRLNFGHHTMQAGGVCPHGIFPVAAEDRTKRGLPPAHERVTEVAFSGDEQWLGTNHRAGSGHSSVVISRKRVELEYEKVADCSEAASGPSTAGSNW